MPFCPGGARLPRGGRMVSLGRRGVGSGTQGTTVGNPPLLEVIRGDCDSDNVAGQNADEVLTDLAGNVGNDLHSVVQPDAELEC